MNPGRAPRVFWWGLVASVLLHLGLLSSAWIVPPVLLGVDEPPPLTAQLVSKPPPPKPAQPVAKATPPQRVKPVPPLPAAEPVSEPEVLPETPAAESGTVMAEPNESSAAIEEPVMAEPDASTDMIEQAAVAEVPAGPPLNPLPNRVRLEYRARIGLATGQMTLLWVNEGDHYTVTSILSPQGMASLFFSGQLVQMSRGRIVATGLQPEEFWDQRDNRRSQSRFNYATQTILTESSKGARTFPLPTGLQDVQSLLFQLALTAPPATESDSAVFNGKKVRSYRYRLVGEEEIDTPLGALRTLHMIRVTDTPAERFEIWLAIDRYFLPVKLATEISGYEAELLVYGMNSEN